MDNETISHDKGYRKSIEDTSIMRKFTILFLLMSMLPAGVLGFFYLDIIEHGRIQISETSFNNTLIFVFLGVFVGYLAMRAVLKKIIILVSTSRDILEQVLDPDVLKEIDENTNEITALTKSFTAVTQRLEDNIRDLELAKKTLHSVLFKVGNGISNMQNIDAFLELILETVSEALNSSAGVLMLLSDDKKSLGVKTVYGQAIDLETSPVFLIDDNSSVQNMVNTKQPIIIEKKIFESMGKKLESTLFKPPVLSAPLIANEKVIGVILISGKKDSAKFNKDELNLLTNLAAQTAVAIKNSQLSRDIEKTYFETVSALALAVDAKDKYSRGHLDRVADYSVIIANKLGLDEEDSKTLRAAARLHDLGKIGIPDNVLCKQGPLSDSEWALMRKHPEIGESIIRPVRSLRYLCDIIRHHHEKLNGTGYPDGLKNDEITPLVRITTVADIYDALTTDRSYRQKMTRHDAFKILREMTKELDQEIVSVFIEALEESDYQEPS